MDDAYWGGKKRDGHRGRGATGKIPFVAAVSTNPEGHPLEMRFSQVSAFSKQAICQWASHHLTGGVEVLSDGLNCFSGFDEEGFSHEVIITGGGPKSVEIEEFKWVNTIIANVKGHSMGRSMQSAKNISLDTLPSFVIASTVGLIYDK